MNIAVIGASAGVGLLTVEEALRKGHHVNTLSRQLPPIADQNLRKMIGSATSPIDVRMVLRGMDAVIIAVGTGASTKATTLYTDTANAVLSALAELKMDIPLIVVTGFGAGDSASYQKFPMNLLFWMFLDKVYENKTEMERLICTLYHNWVIVRPGRLTDDDRTGQYQVITTMDKHTKVGSISRADVADFLVSQAENPTQARQYPVLTY